MSPPEPMPVQTLRRIPRQQRSKDRLDTILNTASDLLDEVGAAGTTITAVAERAGLATSSVYDYVEGDRELIGAVAERGLDRIHLGLANALATPQDADALRTAMSSGLRMFLDRFQTEPGLIEAMAFIDADPELMQLNLADTRRNAALLTEVIQPFLPGAELGAKALLLAHLSGALANLVVRVDSEEAERLIQEFEHLIFALLNPSE